MLKYLVKITQDLLMISLTAGSVYAYIKNNYRQIFMMILRIVMLITAVSAAVMAFFLQNTNKVNQGYVNLAMYGIFIGGFILLLLSGVPILKKKFKAVTDIITLISGSLLIFSAFFYMLPTVFLYPFNFDLSGGSVFSSIFIYKLSGIIFGAVFCFLAALSSSKLLGALDEKKAYLFSCLIIASNALLYAGRAVQVLRTRLLIKSSPLTFNIIKITLNHHREFIFASTAVALFLAVFTYIHNRKVTCEYSNKAQLRKIKAGMRNMRRWCVLFAICACITVVNLTVIDAYNNLEPASAPVEDPILEGDSVIVPFEMVEDGHLHRFGYTSPDGILVKFIVVQKPGSMTYGVGLDACDICGDAGYYERNDQIVCRRCGVVMNTNTIGFKGGCNPIVFDYTVHDGLIDIPASELAALQDEFK